MGIVSGLIGAAGSIINGAQNLKAVKSANATNLQIARETNELNQQINDSQLQYNWDMWHAQNEYNNPAAQRQRLVDAGLNPIYYGLDGNSAASGNSFTPIAAQQASPTIPQNYDAFGDAALRFAQIRNMDADTKQKQSLSGLTDEQAENYRQLRSGLITIQGQQIQLNIDQHLLNGAKREETLASVASMKQSVAESQQRIEDLRSQMSYREFEQKIQQAQYLLDEKYKNGLISIQERNLALGWFDAFTQRQNADTNYYNAETSRMNVKGNLYDMQETRAYRKTFMGSISTFNRTNAQYIHDRNEREQGVYKFEVVSKAADAYSSAVDAAFRITDKVTEGASKVVGSVF